MDAFINDIETYLPSRVLTNEELVGEFPEWDADKVAKKTGIKERHIAADNETSVDMAFQAALKLFGRDPHLKKCVDFIIFCTQTPDYRIPASACLLQNRLGLPTTIGAVDIDLGCSGFIYGLGLAKGLVLGNIAQCVLLLTADTLTKYFHPKDKGNMSIFGDAAAATVVSTQGFAKIDNFVLGTDGGGQEIINIKIGGTRQPLPIHDETIDENGHVKSSDYFYMDGPEVFNFTLDSVPPLLDECLKKNDILKDEIDQYILHQANGYILNTIRKVYGVPKEKFYINMEHYGNTVSSTIPLAIKDARLLNIIHDGNRVLIAGFGVGFSYGACLLEF